MKNVVISAAMISAILIKKQIIIVTPYHGFLGKLYNESPNEIKKTHNQLKPVKPELRNKIELGEPEMSQEKNITEKRSM